LIVANYTRASVNTRLASAFPVVSIHEGIATDVMSSFTMDTIKSIIVIDSDRKMTTLKYTTVTVNGFSSLLPDGRLPVTKYRIFIISLCMRIVDSFIDVLKLTRNIHISIEDCLFFVSFGAFFLLIQYLFLLLLLPFVISFNLSFE
jgi:hypothetical protein